MSSLPRYFAGCFYWRGNSRGQEFKYAFEKITVDRGSVVATGQGVSITGASVHVVRIRMRVDAADFRVVIRESEPERIMGRSGYVTDGAYRGRLSDDMRKITATWTTNRTGEKGQLYLDSVEEGFDGPETKRSLRCEGESS